MIADWIEMVSRHNRSLGALLRGVLMIEKQDDRLRFVWSSEFHKNAGSEREPDLREYLGALRDLPITAWSISTDLCFTNSVGQDAVLRRAEPYYYGFVRQWRTQFVKIISPIMKHAEIIKPF